MPPPRTSADTDISRAAIESAPYAVFVCNDDGVFERVNAAFTRLTGFDADSLVNRRTFVSLLDPAEVARRDLPVLSGVQSDETPYDGEWSCLHHNRTRLPVRLALSCVEGAPGERRWVGIVLDLSQEAQIAQQLWYVTHHDEVTRLPNQRLLIQRLELAISRCARLGGDLSVLLIELEQLRQLQGAFGQPTAERALQIAAERLRSSAGPEDTVACIGGRQFVVVTPGTGERALSLGERMRIHLGQSIDAHPAPLTLDACVGVASYPAHGDTPEALMRRASVALADALTIGGGVRVFRSAMDTASNRRQELESLLRAAFAEPRQPQLHVVYQPQVTLADGAMRCVETLMRWRHPVHGMISPGEFVPVAEACGLIVPLGEWVMRRACREASLLLRRSGVLPRVSVNVSPQQFHRQDVVAMVRRALDDFALEPRYLEIEITESVLLTDAEPAGAALRELHELGVEIAVDDFGTGYASLAYLTRFPADRLKIDQSFVRNMLTDPQCNAIVAAVIAMAHALGLRVTAEGVETAEQAKHLTELGCDEAQGYWFARPMDARGLYHVIAPLGNGARR
ncbi:diguanylate phosphodiesterase [Pandoraea terrae]|uniref:Diguanylate phosphodiesterase n=1 Tax=Pandoraea terrae TaxID=1537710 RepID=A0A5E4TR30_9BURK|nr:bifunctional diguanylate cyclase/phosphodiesterase [Pandoraea terrae]VVD90390.1 diguanylate phosphodiesterase [Pandoraea terrae]